MKIKQLTIIFLLAINLNYGQSSYTKYLTGSPKDTITKPKGGVCLAGGGLDNDEAMKWFLQKANGGDVLILRASGSDGYNNYFYSELGIPVNSVETIVFNTKNASYENYIQQKIKNAEAIWIAGGDQWNYVSFWRGTPIEVLINEAISSRDIVIGGTSAGMAILGGFYFSAQNDTVTSETALNNPYDDRVAIDSAHFISNNYLSDVITDTHYDNRTRRGRQITFLARILVDSGIKAKGIACNEHTAVCIEKNGIAKVFGDFPSYNTGAYFIQTNCELPTLTPENCKPNTPLTWNLEGKALQVYSIKGTANGTNTFDLKDWKTGNGGVWKNWSINNGILTETLSTQINCAPFSQIEIKKQEQN